MYNDGIFADVRRLWFGYKRGASAPGLGAAAANSETEQLTYVERFYPKGPIKILKFGVIAASTHGKGEEIVALYRNASRLGVAVASTSSNEYVINSVAVNKICAAGSYLNIICSTNVCSTGSVACFVDYVPLYDQNRWGAGTQDGRANRVAA